ncbi:unnamed protein product [Zymoseptoria tritici ST99CH_1A5]|uniref:Uncharacterized protein n=1 Tax=Zymoseptoria tritici ST99CH_1A5 TaxID=1276529 RepID=A0A1Y6LKR2_ZYMTR|nr:unnamed protein product [Zymoseptoria tritici ST99CH_1A5]
MAKHQNTLRSGLSSICSAMIVVLIFALAQLGSSAKTPASRNHGSFFKPRDLPASPRLNIARDAGTLPSGIRMPPQLPFTFNDTVESIQDKARAYIALQDTALQKILDSVRVN